MGYFGVVTGFNNCFGVSSQRLISLFLNVAIFLLYQVVLSLCGWWWWCGCGWYSQRLLSLSPTKVMVVLLLGLLLLLGCDNRKI